MLTSTYHHLWALDPSSAFITPTYFNDHYGGSYPYFPATVVPTDQRVHLPFWGSGYVPGGCCYATQTGVDGFGWSRAYTLDVALTDGASVASEAGSGSVLLSSGIVSLGAVSVYSGAVLTVGASASACEFSAGGSLALWGSLSASASCALSVVASGSGSWLQTGGVGTFGQGAGLGGSVIVSGSGTVVSTLADANLTFAGLVTVEANANFIVGGHVVLSSGIASHGAVSVYAGAVLSVGASASTCEFAAGGLLTLSGILSTSANCALSVAAVGDGLWLQTGGFGSFRQGSSLSGPMTVSGSGSGVSTAAGSTVTIGGLLTVGVGASFNVGGSGEQTRWYQQNVDVERVSVCVCVCVQL